MKTSRLLGFAVAVLTATAGGGAERAVDHLVIVSVDGLRPEFYLDEKWPAPMMQQMSRGGVSAERARGVFPSVTYPSHTTILTGAMPARHGVYYNAPFEPGGQTGRWYWESDLVLVPTLWDAVRDAGLKAANLGWPVSVGADVEWNLPEVWSIDAEVESIERMRELTTPAGLWAELEREATGRLTATTFTIDHLTRDDRAGDAAAYLIETYRPNLLTVHLIETDHFQHETGRSGDLVRRAVAAADRALSQMVEAAERAGILGRTAFIVTGDHGHVDTRTQVRPNVWLVGAGLMEDASNRGLWRATFHTTGATAFLHLEDPGDAGAVAAARAAIEAQPPEVRRLFRVVEREELDRLGAAPEAAFALAGAPGTGFSASATAPALGEDSGATHGHLFEFPEIYTGFVAWGAGLRRRAAIREIGLEDIAPLAAALLGLDIEAPDGVLREDLLATDDTPGLAERVDAYVQPYVDIEHFSGSLLVAHGDDVLYEKSFGLANREHGVPNGPRTRFCVGSINKPMTLVILARLIELGKLSAEDMVAKFLPELPRGGEITIGDLARHEAGIPHRVTERSDEIEPQTPASMVGLAARRELVFEPGTDSVYSSAGFSVLARILEVAGGKPYAELLAEHLLQPAGMVDTSDAGTRGILEGRASSYYFDTNGFLNAPPEDISYLVGAGSAYSTPRDLWAMQRALLAGELGDTAREFLVRESGNLTWNGLAYGFRAFVDYDAKSGVTVALASNVTSGALDRIREALPRIAAGEAVPVPSPPPAIAVDVDPAVLAGFEGLYELRRGRNLALRVVDGRVRMNEWLLIPTAPTTLFSPQDYAEIEVVLGAAGEVERLDWTTGGQTYPMPRVGALAPGEE